MINDWENNIAYWEEPKQSEALAGNCDLFHAAVNNWWVWEQAAQPQEKVFNLYPHLCLKTVIPAFKSTQNCYLHDNINITY